MQHKKITVKGKVQGVFFRASTKRRANSLGLVGTVRNLQNGDVEIYAQGESDKLEQLVKWCQQGPQLAKVTQVDSENLEDLADYQQFSIIK
jgi:acylphosphatase